MTTKPKQDNATKQNTISKALQPHIAMVELPRKYFLAPFPQTQATQGVLERQAFVIYNLESAPIAAIAYLVRHGIATAKKPVDMRGIDQIAWARMDRWWVVNEILGNGGTVSLYDSREAAVQALASLSSSSEGSTEVAKP